MLRIGFEWSLEQHGLAHEYALTSNYHGRKSLTRFGSSLKSQYGREEGGGGGLVTSLEDRLSSTYPCLNNIIIKGGLNKIRSVIYLHS